MRIVGLLAWFDEEPDWLFTAVACAAKLCDHVVALDGAYALFPNAEARSPFEQHRAIEKAAHTSEIGLTLKAPEEPWQGNQIEKRSALFEIGKQVTDERDWFLVFDADEFVARVPLDARSRLERAREDVAVYTLGGERYHRGLFRALRSLRVEDAHYHYVAERGEQTIHLRGNEAVHRLERFFTLTDLRVYDHGTQRSLERKRRVADYKRLLFEQEGEKQTPEQWLAVA